MDKLIERWCEQIRDAAGHSRALCLRGGGSKDFYGETPVGEVLDTSAYRGVVAFEPTELVVTARAGTPLAELEALLAEQGQQLPFEPPSFGSGATVGGCVAAGLSGPGRQAAGAVRDYVLGVRLIDGRGDLLGFGGQVMKNVAGYDVARLVAGSLGTLGLITEVSLKVLPRPAATATLRFSMAARTALDALDRWSGQPLPLSASSWHDGVLTLRLAGARAAVDAAARSLGGEMLPDTEALSWWRSVREQRHAFFAPADNAPLWRLAVPAGVAEIDLSDDGQFIEWGGGQRWSRSRLSAATVRERVAAVGGHATLFRGGDSGSPVFHPPAPAVMDIHRRLKAAFDPAGILNPGRLYSGI